MFFSHKAASKTKSDSFHWLAHSSFLVIALFLIGYPQNTIAVKEKEGSAVSGGHPRSSPKPVPSLSIPEPPGSKEGGKGKSKESVKGILKKPESPKSGKSVRFQLSGGKSEEKLPEDFRDVLAASLSKLEPDKRRAKIAAIKEYKDILFEELEIEQQVGMVDMLLRVEADEIGLRATRLRMLGEIGYEGIVPPEESELLLTSLPTNPEEQEEFTRAFNAFTEKYFDLSTALLEASVIQMESIIGDSRFQDIPTTAGRIAYIKQELQADREDDHREGGLPLNFNAVQYLANHPEVQKKALESQRANGADPLVWAEVHYTAIGKDLGLSYLKPIGKDLSDAQAQAYVNAFGDLLAAFKRQEGKPSSKSLAQWGKDHWKRYADREPGRVKRMRDMGFDYQAETGSAAGSLGAESEETGRTVIGKDLTDGQAKAYVNAFPDLLAAFKKQEGKPGSRSLEQWGKDRWKKYVDREPGRVERMRDMGFDYQK